MSLVLNSINLNEDRSLTVRIKVIGYETALKRPTRDSVISRLRLSLEEKEIHYIVVGYSLFNSLDILVSIKEKVIFKNFKNEI